MDISNILKRPSAYLPLVMSLVALSTVVFHLVSQGAAPQADEGAAAHIWQLLMAGQIPFVVVFAAKWLPQVPRQGMVILALQIAAALAAATPVFLLHW